MLIPSIDLMGGKIVQLVQGEKKKYETTRYEEWCSRFAGFPVVQLIDLDAAKRKGNNRALIADFVKRLPCQVGGGIRTAEDAAAMLALGAKRVIVGSSLIRDGAPDVAFAKELAATCGADRIIAAIDSRAGRVAVHGWKDDTALTAAQMIDALDPYVGAYLYTHIDSEGMLAGFPVDVARRLRAQTERTLIAAGGIRSQEEIHALHAMGVDAVVGMAIYTGVLNLDGAKQKWAE
jgi:phosphoribosylformimino-5-aminoimidazole carboxamide ribotide isomerase